MPKPKRYVNVFYDNSDSWIGITRYTYDNRFLKPRTYDATERRLTLLTKVVRSMVFKETARALPFYKGWEAIILC